VTVPVLEDFTVDRSAQGSVPLVEDFTLDSSAGGGSGTSDHAALSNLAFSVAGHTGALPIANGGTGETTAQGALYALLPNQAAANGKFLVSNNSVAGWGVPTLASSVVAIRNTAVATSLTESDCFLNVDATLGPVVVTMPLISGTTVGRQFWVKKTDASNYPVTIARAGSDTFDSGGSTSVAISLGTAVYGLICPPTGTVWSIF